MVYNVRFEFSRLSAPQYSIQVLFTDLSFFTIGLLDYLPNLQIICAIEMSCAVYIEQVFSHLLMPLLFSSCSCTSAAVRAVVTHWCLVRASCSCSCRSCTRKSTCSVCAVRQQVLSAHELQCPKPLLFKVLCNAGMCSGLQACLAERAHCHAERC